MITWGELKQFMEDEGIKEDQEIAVIELTGSFTELIMQHKEYVC